MSIRTERVASLIKQEVAQILEREYRDAGFGFITVTDVRVTADLKIARISLSILGRSDREEVLKELEGEKQYIRGLLGRRLRLKYTPALQLYLDDTMDRVDRINSLIRKIHRADQQGGNNQAG